MSGEPVLASKLFSEADEDLRVAETAEMRWYKMEVGGIIDQLRNGQIAHTRIRDLIAFLLNGDLTKENSAFKPRLTKTMSPSARKGTITEAINEKGFTEQEAAELLEAVNGSLADIRQQVVKVIPN